MLRLQLILSRNVTGLSWEVVVSRSPVSFTTPLDGCRPRPIRWLQGPDRRADAAAQRQTHSGCDQTGFNGLLSFSSSVLPAHGEPYQPPQLPGSARPSASILGALLPDPEEHAGRRRRHPVRTETLCTRTPALKRFSVFVAEPQLLRPLLVHTCSYALHPSVITHTCRV